MEGIHNQVESDAAGPDAINAARIFGQRNRIDNAGRHGAILPSYAVRCQDGEPLVGSGAHFLS